MRRLRTMLPRVCAFGAAYSHLSPAGRGRFASGALAERSKSGEGNQTLERHIPPHPNPLPAGERERAEFAAPPTDSEAALRFGGEAEPADALERLEIEGVHLDRTIDVDRDDEAILAGRRCDHARALRQERGRL